MKSPARWLAASAVALPLCFAAPAHAREVRINARLGEAFPDLSFDSLLAPADYTALGLAGREGAFRLTEIPGRLLVLEFFNQYCMTCQRQAPYLQSFFEGISSGDLAGEVRLLTVGVGNRPGNLEEFRRELALAYPMAPDPYFERYLEVGDPGGTPFTVFLLRQGEQWTLADFHLGMQGDTELTARSRILIEGKADIAKPAPAGEGDRHHHPPLGLTAAEQEERARAFLSRIEGVDVTVRTLEVAEGATVYEASAVSGSSLGVFARIASRDPVCDVCHAVHFLFAFDREGRVRGYEPIHVTKFGNALWSAEDNARMDRILAGRGLRGLEFDPDVDAVASATMSSALIFDEVRRAQALLEALRNP